MSALFKTKPVMSDKSLISLAQVMPNAGMRIVAPASSAKVEVAQLALSKLRSMSFQPRFGQHAFRKGPLFFAGTASQRLQDLHDAFADENSSVVVCLRGGYGSNYLLDGLDTELIRSHPKPFLAYSDLTGIQLHLLDSIGLPAFHGPMAATDFAVDNGIHTASLLAALGGEPYSVGDAEGMRALKMGELDEPVTGILYGGCLSILASLVGTPWEPQTEGKLLFLEDTGAKPYQIDRMLWQLRHAGKLEGIKGVIFGEMPDCSSPGASVNLLEEVILQHFEDMDIPIAIGLRSGHVSRQNVTLVFGVEAELEMAGLPRLTLRGTR
jgi:muramoyltetrapeptide carboxypeptidase